MLSHKSQETGDRGQQSEGLQKHKAAFCLLMAVGCLMFVSGCRMDMQDQPKYKAYRKGSIRMPVDGTVARGYLREDKHLYTGKKDRQGSGTPPPVASPNPTLNQQIGGPAVSPAAMYPDVVDTFPFPITEKIVKRGEERYNIFCGACHGPTGNGDGMVIRRGFRRRPPSYHTDQLRQAPVGHFFDVITNGWGVMPSHAALIPVTDRWSIVAYVRALQISQNPQGATATPSPSPSAEQSRVLQKNEPAIRYRVVSQPETGERR